MCNNRLVLYFEWSQESIGCTIMFIIFVSSETTFQARDLGVESVIDRQFVAKGKYILVVKYYILFRSNILIFPIFFFSINKSIYFL